MSKPWTVVHAMRIDETGAPSHSGCMDIPWQKLPAETLRALIEEYVSREGTDYGSREIAFDTKVEQVERLLATGKIKIVFDAETESCDLREVISSSRKTAIVDEPQTD